MQRDWMISSHRGGTLAVLAAALGGCTATRGAVPALPRIDAAQSADTAAISAALVFFAGRGEGVVRVDPRPLRADASLQGVRARDLDTADAAEVRVREAFLKS